jgi:hypothetical protein
MKWIDKEKVRTKRKNYKIHKEARNKRRREKYTIDNGNKEINKNC